jgi:hypothetical protein
MELGPQPVAVDGEAQKDEHGNGRPDDLKQIVAVGIMCSLTLTAAIPDKINDQNRLHGDEDEKREPEDEIQNAIDPLTPYGIIWRHPIEITTTLLGEGVRKAEHQR